MRIAALSTATLILAAGAAYAQPAATPAPAAAATGPAATPAVATPAPVATTPASTASTAAKVTTAAANSTLGLIIAKGMTMSIGGMDILFSFKSSEGTFDAGLFTGKYWVDAAKMCFDIPDIGYNACSAYPTGKKSGDAFSIETDNGPADVKIN